VLPTTNVRDIMKKTTEHIALFVDLENYFGFCNGLGLPVDLGMEIDKMAEIGKVTIRRSFGDIQKMPCSSEKKGEMRRMLQKNKIIHEDIPYQTQYKNSSDIRLVIEVLSLVFSNQDINIVAVAGCDRDYIPLFTKLREIGKEIIGISGSKDNTPDVYVKAADYFFYHENLSFDYLSSIEPTATGIELEIKHTIEPSIDTSTNPHENEFVKQPTTQHKEAELLLLSALKILEQQGEPKPHGGMIIGTMRRLQADFDARAYGFSGFQDICDRAAESGLVKIISSDSQFRVKLQPLIIKPAEIACETEDMVGLEPVRDAGFNEGSALRQWIEAKLRIKLPDLNDRQVVYKLLQIALPPGKSAMLKDLSHEVAAQIEDKLLSQAVYKILYNVYRSNCFSCSQGDTPFNPIINSFETLLDDPKAIDRFFIVSTMRSYKAEFKKKPFAAVEWSEVFFNSLEHVNDISEIWYSS